MLAKLSLALTLCVTYVFALGIEVQGNARVGNHIPVHFNDIHRGDPTKVDLLLEHQATRHQYPVSNDVDVDPTVFVNIPSVRDFGPYEFIATNVRDPRQEYARSNIIIIGP